MDMRFLKLLSYFLLLSSFNLASSDVDTPTYYDHSCTINKNFTSSNPYQYNLNTLLLSLYSKATSTDTTPEFYNTTSSTTNTNNTDAEAAYGAYMCRGDVPIEVCKNCVQDATNRIASECPNNKEAIIWYDQCFVRYSNRSFFSTLHQLPTVNSSLRTDAVGRSRSCLSPQALASRCNRRSDLEFRTQADSRYTGNNLSNAYIVLNKTLNDAVVEVASTSRPAGTKKFATKEANLSSSESLYSLVQCTPDLSPQFCQKCLYDMMERIPKEHTSSSGRIMNPSCNLRFGRERFYYKDNQPPADFTSQEFGRPTLTNWDCCSCTTKANWTANDPYLNKLESLFHNLSISSNLTENKGFYNTTVGNKSDKVYGLFMCRGDVPVELCHECVNEGIQKLNSTCSSSKEAVVWYDMCMLRYSNRSFFSALDIQPIHRQNGADMLEDRKASFNRLLTITLNNLVVETPNSVGVKNFETKNESSSSEFTTLYTLAQCVPNLSSQDCHKCLQVALEQIKSYCLGTKGGQVVNPSCNLRFETYRFYNDSKRDVSVPPAHLPTPKVNSSGGKDNDHSRIIIIAVSVLVASIMLFYFGFYYWKRNKSKSYKAILKKNFGSEGATLESLQFNLTTIEAATDKFSLENRIGKGGFGEVYMGILPDGNKIAVKRLSENSRQGLLEFKNEVLLIAKLQHRNLVALLGFCLKDQEKLLVYEYVPNKSLDYFLFGSQKSRVLNWSECYKIIGGIARGILYLHEHSRLKVIHRDLKPSNILLDDEMNPKISDFGMARMVGINETRGNTNRIVGTLGYMSPEYVKFGLFSEKSDVFSFGVIVLEIISGKNINSQSESHESHYAGGLLSDAWKHWRDENFLEILDSNLTQAGGGSQSEIIKCMHIGLLCVQGNPQVRPSMNEVVQYLSNESIQLPIPQEPAFFIHNQMEAATTSRAMEAQHANHNQYSINEISETTSFPR